MGDHSSSVATDLTPSGTFKTAPTFMTTPVTDDRSASTSQEPITTTGSTQPSELPTGADDMTGSPSPSSETPIIDSTGPLTGPTTGPGTGPGFTPGDPGSSIPPSGSTTSLSTSDNTEVVTELASLSPTTEGVVATTTATSDLATSPGKTTTSCNSSCLQCFVSRLMLV
ncbi:uncharacterized protein [Diadema antillarum]|uniref:uncharacterized protein n=1 Tax=Diadema antillarum TaxID=105358 RepID=UPI003A845C01